MTVFDQGSQKERAEIMQAEAKLRRPSQEPREPDTYFSRAQQSDPAQPFEPVPTLQVPRLPASSPFAGDPVPPEPTIDATDCSDRLGYPIDQMPKE
jgi:hypothetical protein